LTSSGNIFVIVPAYNESYIIRETVTKLLDEDFSVVVVDDGSLDNTGNELKGLPVFYIRHLINLGQGAALQTGIEYALRHRPGYLVTFDADGQHDVKDIRRMVELLEKEKAAIVFGSRFLPGSQTNVPVARKWVLKIARMINYLASGILLSDANNGLRVMTREAAMRLKITENRSSHNAQVQRMVSENKLRYCECAVNVSYSEYSRKKGLKNVNSIRILYDLILFKIFR